MSQWLEEELSLTLTEELDSLADEIATKVDEYIDDREDLFDESASSTRTPATPNGEFSLLLATKDGRTFEISGKWKQPVPITP